MSKISTYSLADTPLSLSDRLIGTEAFRTTPTPTPLATKNFSLGELLQLFSANFPAASLQAVLNTGNTATQNINLTGTIDVTLIKPDNIEDTSGSQGTVFQYLSKGTSSINWVDLPVDTLQSVLNAGNTATQNITLVGNITSTRIIPGNIQDDTGGIGTTGQFLSKTASGIRWVNSPAAATPTLGDVVSVGDTANQDIFISGLRIGKGPGTGSSNTALGVSSLSLNTTGYYNVATGAFTLTNNTTGNRNSALGYGALYENTTGNLNVAIGSYSLFRNQTGLANVSLGYAALQANLIGSFNTALGYRTLFSNLADKNTAVGTETMFSNTTGTFNTVVGQEALRTNIAGSFNAALGNFALLNAEASYVSALGRDAGRLSSAGNLTTASESIFIGYNSKSLNSSSINEIVIGANAVGLGDNTVVLGSDLITKTALKGDVGVGTTAPSQKLHVDGNLRVTGAIYDSTNSPGTAGQVLSSTATGTDWINVGTVTSIGMTVPSAFNVTPSTITSSGTFAITGAGVASQYIRGDGTLANFPTSTGGGASVSYYLNGSISQGTIGGVAYKEMNSVPVIGTGTDFTINADGYIAQFITDVGDPNKLLIPGGNWNFETYFSASSGGGSPQFYVELYKYDGTTFTLIASNSASPRLITDGTNIEAYFSALAVPATTLLVTDRLAVRFYVIHSGRTITMHTENSHLCQVITTFSSGLTALNGLTSQVQYFAVGTSGTDFNISSATDTHTFNLPTASAVNRGALSSADWTAFNGKFNLPALTSGSVLFSNGTTIAQDNANLFWDDTNNRLGIGTASITRGKLEVKQSIDASNGGIAIVNSAVSGSLRLWVDSTGVSNIANGTTSNISILSSGNVGIGTTNPLQKLHIADVGSAIAFDTTGATATNLIRTINSFELSLYCGRGTTTEAIVGNDNFRVLTSTVERMRINQNGNVGIGAATANARLDVRAQGALSTDIALRVRNSADTTDLFQVLGNGSITMSAGASFYTLGNNLNFRSNLAGGSGYIMDLASFNTLNSTSLEQGIGSFVCTYAPTSGTGTLNGLKITTIINQTGGANGITRGLFINPTLTAAADFRAIETTVGNVILGSTSGNVGIGTASPGIKLQVETSVNGSDGIWTRNVNTGTSAYGAVIANSAIGGIGLRAHSAAHGAWPNTSMLHSASGFSNGLVLFQEGAFPIAFWTNANERMRITSTGNVGIGTTSPTFQLDVNRIGGANEGKWARLGSIIAAGEGSGSYPSIGYNIESNVSGFKYIAGDFASWIKFSAGGMQFNTAASGTAGTAITATTSMAILQNGNVGIGTTSPGASLDILATSLNVLRLGRTGYDTFTFRSSIGSGLELFNTTDLRSEMFFNGSGNIGIGTTAPTAKLHIAAPGALSTDVAFKVRNSADTADLMLVNGLGNIGIGISTPTEKLDVNGAIQIRGTRVNNSGEGGFMDYSAGRFRLLSQGQTNTTAGEFLFTVRELDLGGSVDALYIGNTGNVGIGTTAPFSKFTTSGALTTSTSQISIVNTEGGHTILRTGISSISNAGFSLISANADGTNQNTRLVISAAGNVGIGNTAPGYNLDVTGSIRATQYVYANDSFVGNNLISISNNDLLINKTTAYSILLYTSGTEKMRINAAGNVGIGTTAPVGRLDVRAPGALSIDTAFRVRNSADSNNLMIINGAGGIGVGTTSPLPSAVLDINSTTQGFLPPRMTNAQRLAISLPAVGLMVYCTDATEGLYIYKSTGWTFII